MQSAILSGPLADIVLSNPGLVLLLAVVAAAAYLVGRSAGARRTEATRPSSANTTPVAVPADPPKVAISPAPTLVAEPAPSAPVVAAAAAPVAPAVAPIASSVDPSPEIFAVIAAAIAATFGKGARIASVKTAPPLQVEVPLLPWSLEGRRDIYSSHRVR